MKPYNNIRWRKYKLNENKLANMKDKNSHDKNVYYNNSSCYKFELMKLFVCDVFFMYSSSCMTDMMKSL